MFWLTAIGKSNCEPPVPCALTNSAFCLFLGSYHYQQTVTLGFQPAILPGTVCTEDGYNMDSHTIIAI